MAGVTLDVEFVDDEVAGFLDGLLGWQIEDLAFNVGALLESAVKERIATGKTAPDGEPWAEWSTAYAATRAARHSLLVGDGNPGLLESVQNYSAGATARVGTNLVYGAIHQFGGAGVGKPGLPARPYLGVSAVDRVAIRDLIVGELEEMTR